MNTFEPKYAKFFYEDLNTPCSWEQMTKLQLAEFCDLAAGEYFNYKNATQKVVNAQSEQIKLLETELLKLKKGRTVRNWLLFLSLCFTLFVMCYDAGVLF